MSSTPARRVAHSTTIRRMEMEDLRPVCELGARLFSADQSPILHRTWSEQEVVEHFASDGDYCLVAEADDRVVGFALGSMVRKEHSAWRYGWLLWLGVARGMKRRGIGKRLIDRLTDLFIENGARMMMVDTAVENERAIALFRKVGFTDESRHLYLFRNLNDHPHYRELNSGP